MSTFAAQLAEKLEPIAANFASLNLPEPVVHWGHPAMMGIVVLVMGSYAVWAGWQGRLATDADTSLKQRKEHAKVAALMTTFLAMGYTGGILSLVMQKHAILESPHFWTGTIVLTVLMANGAIAAIFKRKQDADTSALLRKFHAYLGSTAFALLLVHGALGLKLGLSL
jgi:hypothetical protein